MTYAAEHETPVKTFDIVRILDVLESDIHNISDHDSECSPSLPHHDECAANQGRRTSGSAN